MRTVEDHAFACDANIGLDTGRNRMLCLGTPDKQRTHVGALRSVGGSTRGPSATGAWFGAMSVMTRYRRSERNCHN
jgi:hypothetical protein